jgi:hypothetical protein
MKVALPADYLGCADLCGSPHAGTLIQRGRFDPRLLQAFSSRLSAPSTRRGIPVAAEGAHSLRETADPQTPG